MLRGLRRILSSAPQKMGSNFRVRKDVMSRWQMSLGSGLGSAGKPAEESVCISTAISLLILD